MRHPTSGMTESLYAACNESFNLFAAGSSTSLSSTELKNEDNFIYTYIHRPTHTCMYTYILTYTHIHRPTFIVHTQNETLLLDIVGSHCWRQISRKPPTADVIFWISPSEFAFACRSDRDMRDSDLCIPHASAKGKDSHTCEYYIVNLCHMPQPR